MAQSTSRARTTSSWRQRHRPLPEREGHTVVSLLASHIADRRRLEYLEHCLVSVANQEVHVEALYLSWYATTEALAAELQALFRRLRLPFRFRPIRQQRQCSQYQHLREALAACQREAPAAPASLWVTFADDDDLWHSQRIRLVRKACTAAEREISAITFGIYAYPVNQGPHESKTVSDVKRALDSREAAMWLGPSEIFQFVVRHHVLAAYLASEPECILSHRFSDVRFAQFIRHQPSGARGKVLDIGAEELMQLGGAKASDGRSEAKRAAWLSDHWMYFYRNTRQLTQTTQMNSLEDMQAYTNEASALARAQGGGHADYERTSTGLNVKEKDKVAAKALAKRSRQFALDAEVLATEVGRMRHHAELCVVMCLHVSNAADLAIEMCRQATAGAPSGHPPQVDKLLWDEQVRLVHEACRLFEHGAPARGKLPVGTMQDCIG